jgi:hypothetical protein
MFDEILLNPFGIAVHYSTGPGPKATDLSAGAQAGVSPWYGVYFLEGPRPPAGTRAVPKATDACLPSHRQVSPWYGVYSVSAKLCRAGMRLTSRPSCWSLSAFYIKRGPI